MALFFRPTKPPTSISFVERHSPARYLGLVGFLAAALIASSVAFAQTPPVAAQIQDLDSDGIVGGESLASSVTHAVEPSGARWPDSCDLRDSVPIAPYPYCGNGIGGLTLRPGSDELPDLLAFLDQTTGGEDVVWLDVEDELREAGRCSPDRQDTISAMAHNDRVLCGRSDTLFVANATTGSGKIVELAATVGGVTSDRVCSSDDPGEDSVEGAESCEILREFRFAGLDEGDHIGALVFADPPSLGRTVLVASVRGRLYFLDPDSPSCGSTVDIVHECPNGNASGLAWMGADRFLVINATHSRIDVLDIEDRGCEIVGTFHTPGSVGGATYDRDRGLLYVTVGGEDVLYALSLDPTDRNPVAIAQPDAIKQCSVSRALFLDARGSCDPDDAPLALDYTWTTPDGEQLSGSVVRVSSPPVGTYTYELRVGDGRGNYDTDLYEVTIVDTLPPRISGLAADPVELWPPNGKLIPVAVEFDVAEACDPEPRCAIVDIESSDPTREGVPDWEFRSDLEVALRAKRDGEGDRIYTLTVECSDASGNASSSTTEVRVAHNDLGSTCACWSRDELNSIAPNPDTETWSQTCKTGDGIRPDSDSIRRSQGRLSHVARAESRSDVGEYQCQYFAAVPNLPRVGRSLSIDEGAYEICRDQIRRRQRRLGITDECEIN